MSRRSVLLRLARRAHTTYPQQMTVFWSCLPGLEQILVRELEMMVPSKSLQIFTGGVETTLDESVDEEKLRRFASRIRTSSHCLIRRAIFTSRALGELRRKAKALPWNKWVPPGDNRNVRLDIVSSKSRLYHEGAIRDCIMQASGLEQGQREESVAKFLFRFENDNVTLSQHLTLGPLHHRGYRAGMAVAPLREDLAAAMVIASGWNPETEALLDPFCGSGTLLIEAALRFPQSTAIIRGSDYDRRAVRIAKESAKLAGVSQRIKIDRCSYAFQEWLQKGAQPPERGLVLSNPPFGRRLPYTEDMFRSFGKKIPRGWRCVVLTSNAPKIAAWIGARDNYEKLLTVVYGGLRVHAIEIRK